MGAWKAIGEAVVERLNEFACTPRQLEDLVQKPVLYKILSALRKDKKIKYEYPLREKKCRPEILMSNRPINYPQHDKRVTDICLALGISRCRRIDLDPGLRPDWEMVVEGELIYGEADTGSERGAKIDDRLSLYHEVGSRVLWVVKTKERCLELRKKDRRNKNSLFGVLEDVVNNPHGDIWRSHTNELITLEKQDNSSCDGDVTDMAQRQQSQPEVVNGNGRLQFDPGYPPPAGQHPKQPPQQVLIMQQPAGEHIPVNPHLPQLPSLSEASYVGMQQLQLALSTLPVILPLAMSTPQNFLNSVSEKMDDLTNHVEGYEEARGKIRFDFRQ